MKIEGNKLIADDTEAQGRLSNQAFLFGASIIQFLAHALSRKSIPFLIYVSDIKCASTWIPDLNTHSDLV
jgi:hypothetical protein